MSEWRIVQAGATIRHSVLAIRWSIMDAGQLEARKTRARAWFETLREELCAAFEAIEDEASAALHGPVPGRFTRTPWTRADHTGAPGGGGTMAMMTGRL